MKQRDQTRQQFSWPGSTTLAERLRGILLPFSTPFTAAEEIDLDGLTANLQKWNKTAIAGYVALGSTGERLNLDEPEYLEVIETTRKTLGSEKLLIVGAGQQSTRGTISEIRRVLAQGAVDAFLLITPSFYRPSITQQALIAHYQTIADESPSPIILYSMPALTGIKIEPETAASLSKHANIIGIKDSSNDVTGLTKTNSSSAKTLRYSPATALCLAMRWRLEQAGRFWPLLASLQRFAWISFSSFSMDTAKLPRSCNQG